MKEPRLRHASKAAAPYPINQFPHSFIKRFTEDMIYLHATKDPVTIEGEEWEQVFARCIDAEWKPSNIGLDDVQLGSCCWSAKTVKGSKNNLGAQKEVRLISGRCSPVFSFEKGAVGPDDDPNLIGKMVLSIWNERVSEIRSFFKVARTVVLVKGENCAEFLIFETDTVRYDPEAYEFSWNKNHNLEGREKQSGKHRFTWQPHGSQLTIKEDIPAERLHIKVKVPEHVDKMEVIRAAGYDESNLSYWVMKLP